LFAAWDLTTLITLFDPLFCFFCLALIIIHRLRRSSPLQRNKISRLDFGSVHTDHTLRFPILFVKPTTSLIGPSETVVIPTACQPVQDIVPDYEVEFTVVIGKPAKNVSEEDALDYVLAYTGGNDVLLSHLHSYL
jgi:hypothetical protein